MCDGASRTIVESTGLLFENVEQKWFHVVRKKQFWRISPTKSHSDLRQNTRRKKGLTPRYYMGEYMETVYKLHETLGVCIVFGRSKC